MNLIVDMIAKESVGNVIKEDFILGVPFLVNRYLFVDMSKSTSF